MKNFINKYYRLNFFELPVYFWPFYFSMNQLLYLVKSKVSKSDSKEIFYWCLQQTIKLFIYFSQGITPQ